MIGFWETLILLNIPTVIYLLIFAFTMSSIRLRYSENNPLIGLRLASLSAALLYFFLAIICMLAIMGFGSEMVGTFLIIGAFLLSIAGIPWGTIWLVNFHRSKYDSKLNLEEVGYFIGFYILLFVLPLLYAFGVSG